MAAERIRLLRNLGQEHNFTLMCRDLSEIAIYAKIDSSIFRWLKTNTPGPYTYILPATKEVPRRLQHPKRKTIGIRVPDNPIIQALLTELGTPLMSVTLILPPTNETVADPEECYEQLENRVDLIIEGGFCGTMPTTVVDFLNNQPLIVRTGKGDPTPFI
jgi:tRNA threonylcarbamoyl adenosine modification protein (Sua5/YciO/YrdC/YwlC family)